MYEPEMGEKKCPESSPSCGRTSIHAWMILDVLGIAGENQQFIRMGFIHGLYHGDQPHTNRNAHHLHSFTSAIQLLVKMSVEMLHEMVA